MRDTAAPAGSPARAGTAPDPTSATIEALVTQWVGIIRRAALRYHISGPDVQELEQDIRLRLWRMVERPELESRGISAGYVYRAAVSAAIDLVRRRRTERHDRRVPLALVENELVDGGAVAQDESAMLAAIERALMAVPASRRPAVRLHLSGRHLDEIANVMGWSRAKARNLLYRGLEDLRTNLREAHGD
jgi:RNA polymerase sigma-70 factor (ECF subfamily)